MILTIKKGTFSKACLVEKHAEKAVANYEVQILSERGYARKDEGTRRLINRVEREIKEIRGLLAKNIDFSPGICYTLSIPPFIGVKVEV